MPGCLKWHFLQLCCHFLPKRPASTWRWKVICTAILYKKNIRRIKVGATRLFLHHFGTRSSMFAGLSAQQKIRVWRCVCLNNLGSLQTFSITWDQSSASRTSREFWVSESYTVSAKNECLKEQPSEKTEHIQEKFNSPGMLNYKCLE